jgi:hypothetical protein
MNASRWERLARRLVLFLGLAGPGCADGLPPTPPAPSPSPPPAIADTTPAAPPAAPAPVTSPVQAQLERLRGLQIVEVGELVSALPNAATACYGNPCPSDVWDRIVAERTSSQLYRLTRLTDLGAQVAARSYAAPPVEPAAQDLAVLRGLAIVEIGDLLTVVPAASPNCYDLPCQPEIDAAAAENARRASVVHAWATAVKTQRP